MTPTPAAPARTWTVPAWSLVAVAAALLLGTGIAIGKFALGSESSAAPDPTLPATTITPATTATPTTLPEGAAPSGLLGWQVVVTIDSWTSANGRAAPEGTQLADEMCIPDERCEPKFSYIGGESWRFQLPPFIMDTSDSITPFSPVDEPLRSPCEEPQPADATATWDSQPNASGINVEAERQTFTGHLLVGYDGPTRAACQLVDVEATVILIPQFQQPTT